MIEELKRNLNTEKEILKEISIYYSRLSKANPAEERLLVKTLKSLKESLKLINDSLPEIIQHVNIVQKMPRTENISDIPGQPSSSKGLERVTYEREDKVIQVTVSPKLKKKLLKELSINEDLIKRIGKRKKDSREEIHEFKAARGYLKFSNKHFLQKSIDLINKGNFRQVGVNLKKANIEILFETYISMVLMTTLISIFVGIFLTIFMIFFELHLLFPFFSIYDGNYLFRIPKVFWIAIAVPVGTFFTLLYYPGLEKGSIEKKIDQELPFAVIHMAAISGSGIPPSELFRIIGTSNEYPNLKKEIRKILNQINLYGYDLVTSLNNISKSTPSEKLSELFTGLSTTIHSGGGLKEFFEKRAETLLISYKLEREKYSRTAGTFMDIYISVVIAAPMILMILLIMINVSGLGLNLTSTQMSIGIVMIISLLNFLFLGLLQMKQPTY